MERLDECLLDHAVATGTKEGGPDIVDVYKLQGLSEMHYYLKVEHDFTAAEVAALMRFTDPLEVAEMCWEERSHEAVFSICDLLDKINAYERYPLAPTTEPVQAQNRMVTAVKSMLDQNMQEYQESLLRMDKTELIEKSAEIAVMQEAYSFLKDEFKFQQSDAEALLRVENPLRFVADRWPSDICGLFAMDDLMGEVIEEAAKTAASERNEKPSPSEKETIPVQGEKPSIRGQLHDAVREAGQSQSQKEKAKGGDAR